ncbi:glutamate--tRNA ligase [Candidatus Micrarchaeota archaeon]|nr:glutamate--tRNA ligase [Candidatus Micrarchaeota archaeon]
MDKLESLALKWALKNAVDHEGKASAGPVINKVLGGCGPQKDMKALGKLVAETARKVNSMSVEEQRKQLLSLWPGALDKKEEKPRELKELPSAEHGRVVLRIAPNVNGPLHIGHTRGIIINDAYAQKYAGKMILRFDDTDPETKPPMPGIYEKQVEDFTWLLGHKPQQVSHASDRIDRYYEVASQLLSLDHAYTCSCAREKQQELRRAGKPCAHRGQARAENERSWREMLAGKYEKGDIVLKIKTDLSHPNPAIRDWVAFRVAKRAHPRQGTKYCVWPMLDFASLVDDHDLGVTHIIRGKEHMMGTERQEYVYRYLGWEYPHVFYWGRVKLSGFDGIDKISKSLFAKEIAAGKYTGWDDPRLPTVAGLRKQGILPQAIREFWLQMGLSERDVSASWQALEAINERMNRQKSI